MQKNQYFEDVWWFQKNTKKIRFKEGCKPKIISSTQKKMYKSFISKHHVPQIYNHKHYKYRQHFEVVNYLYSHTIFICYSFINGRRFLIPCFNYTTMFPTPNGYTRCACTHHQMNNFVCNFNSSILASCTRIIFSFLFVLKD